MVLMLFVNFSGKLAYPNRLPELGKELGRPKDVLSAIIRTVNDDIYERFHTKFSEYAFILKNKMIFTDIS